MHQLIHGLVYESSPERAIKAATADVFDPLVQRGPYDYFVTFEMSGRGVSGRDRWGSLPAAAPAESSVGQELVERGWQATVNEYTEGFDRIDAFLDQHDREEFWNSRDVHSEYALAFNRVGQFQGPSTYLYDQDGEGIRHRDHLESVLSHWSDLGESSSDENLDLYVVPADVHF